MTDEHNAAIKLATKVLDTHWRDPDDDLSVLARQFLREAERTTAARAEGFRAGVTKAADFVCTIQHIRGTPNAILSLLAGDGKAKVGLTETLTTVLEDARVPGVINDQIVDMIARWEESLTPLQESE